MYTDKTQKVHVSLTKQVNVLKTKDNNHVMFDGSEEVQSISKLEFKESRNLSLKKFPSHWSVCSLN